MKYLYILLALAVVGCGTSNFKYMERKEGNVKVKDYTLDPSINIDENKRYIAEVHTNQGLFEFELHTKEAPVTSKNFIVLANAGYYDGIIFHRVIDGFVIQGGDYSGTGMHGISMFGEDKPFNNEVTPSLKHVPGVVAMANAGPNTNKSQFYVTLGSFPHLDGKYSIFGKIIKGYDVVQKIGKVPVDGSSRPKTEVKMEKVVIRVEDKE